MSTDTFEQDLAARMGAATDTIGADGVTRQGVDERIAARRATRRRRQGGIVLAAAALVVVAGIGAVVLGGGDDPRSTEITDDGGTTEVPTTEAPTTTCPASILPDPIVTDGSGSGCAEVEVVPTEPPTTAPAPTTLVPSETEPPTTTAPPATTTAPPTTTAPVRPPASPTALDFVRGVIEGRDVSALAEAGFDPVADMRSELPEDLIGFVANPVEIFDWDGWSGSSANPRPDDPSCADVGDSSVVCVVSVAREDFSLFLHVYMTGNGPTRVAAVDSDAD